MTHQEEKKKAIDETEMADFGIGLISFLMSLSTVASVIGVLELPCLRLLPISSTQIQFRTQHRRRRRQISFSPFPVLSTRIIVYVMVSLSSIRVLTVPTVEKLDTPIPQKKVMLLLLQMVKK